MHLDEIVNKIGFGQYQLRVCFFLFSVCIFGALHGIGSVFLVATTDHWCSVSDVPGVNCTELNLSDPQCTELKKNLTIPRQLKDTGVVYEQCSRYNHPQNASDIYSYKTEFSNATSLLGGTENCGSAGWDYDHSQYTSTAVQEFDLVCDQQNLPNYAQSVFFAGVLCGSLAFGALSDWIGRYPTFFIALGCEVVAGTVAAFAPNFATFTAMRFFVAMCSYGTGLVSFVLGTELVSPEYRAAAGTVCGLFFSVGYMLLAVLGYFIRDWRTLQIVITAPIILYFLLIPFTPESVRWLVSNGKPGKAEKILRKAAAVNKVILPKVLFDEEEIAEEKKLKTSLVRRTTMLDLFRTPNMRLKTLNILYNWFVHNLVYYGLSLSTSGLGVNIYAAAFVSGAVEFPACLFCWYTMQKFGRRWPLCLFMVTGGLACLLTICIPLGIYRTMVAMIGKFCISGSFNLIYIYSAEIYPTVVRSTGMGVSSMSARVSGILSPIILILGNYWSPLPFFVFGTTSILAGVLSLVLPETLGEPLPETLEDGERIKGTLSWPSLRSTSTDGYKNAPMNDEKRATKECNV